MFRLISKICFLKASPEEIPYSIPLLLGMIAVNFSIIFFLVGLAAGSIPMGILRAILFTIIISTFTYSALYWRGMPERFVQALSGLLGSQTFILTICLIPYILLMSILPEVASNFYYYFGLIFCGFLLVVTSIWLFIIYTRIFESALELSLNSGLFITILLIMINIFIFSLLYFIGSKI